MATKECADCGFEFTPAYRPKQTKRCRVCQVLENLIFLGQRRYECLLCDEEFIPLTSRSLMCGGCRPYRSKHAVSGTCGVCKCERDDLLGEDVKVCSACATDPEHYRAIVKALARKCQERAEGS